jgi:predicted dehydrogenase
MRASPRTAWKRGVPVIVEKPIALTVEDAQHICDVSRSKEIPALVGHHRRYNPIVRHAKQVVDSGKLGAPWRRRCFAPGASQTSISMSNGAGSPAVDQSS